MQNILMERKIQFFQIRNYYDADCNTFRATRKQQNFPQDVVVGDISGLRLLKYINYTQR